MNFKERVEQSPVFWMLTFMVSAYLAGIGSYEAILRISQRKVISMEEYQQLHSGVGETDQFKAHIKTIENKNKLQKDEIKRLTDQLTDTKNELKNFDSVKAAIEKYKYQGTKYCGNEWVDCSSGRVAYRQKNHWRAMLPAEKLACSIWCEKDTP